MKSVVFICLPNRFARWGYHKISHDWYCVLMSCHYEVAVVFQASEVIIVSQFDCGIFLWPSLQTPAQNFVAFSCCMQAPNHKNVLSVRISIDHLNTFNVRTCCFHLISSYIHVHMNAHLHHTHTQVPDLLEYPLLFSLSLAPPTVDCTTPPSFTTLTSCLSTGLTLMNKVWWYSFVSF